MFQKGAEQTPALFTQCLERLSTPLSVAAGIFQRSTLYMHEMSKEKGSISSNKKKGLKQ
jgi:hypothetical protein